MRKRLPEIQGGRPIFGVVACISCRKVETPYMHEINHGANSREAGLPGWHCRWRSGERDLFGHLIDPDPMGLAEGTFS